ncbi:MAG: hypothetical protein R3A12_00290 [Ignavibacteria bacterium]
MPLINRHCIRNYLPYNLDAFAEANGISKEVLEHLISDLKKNQGSSYVSAGSSLPESTHCSQPLK